MINVTKTFYHQMIKKLRYKIINLLHTFSIYHRYKSLEHYIWWLMWQYNLKYYGKQDWCENNYNFSIISEIENYRYGEKHRILFRILIGKDD